MHPIVGITSDYDLGISTKSISPGRGFYFLNKNYIFAVERCGGVPIILPVTNDKEVIERFLENIDGLIISGGGDIDSSYYNEEPSLTLGPINPERQSFEIMITSMALEMDLPILGICGGAQVLNVAAGGTLYQDIYSSIPDAISHRQRAPRWYPFHTIEIHKNTKLYEILKIDALRVNSRHHQAVRNLAEDFIESASTSDGLIEAIESKKHKFALGIQCHPEDMFEGEEPCSKALFQAFIKACQK